MPGKQVTELDALPSFTDTSLLPVHNGAGLKKGLLSQLASYLGNKFSNPNLLINPDFKINQRGQSEYAYQTSGATQYTVDRFRVVFLNVKTASDGLILNANGANAGGGYCSQVLEDVVEGNTILSFKVSAVVGTIEFRNLNSADAGDTITVSSDGIYTIKGNNTKKVIAHLTKGSSCKIEWMKLEQGSIATPFVAPNPAEESVKCKRYFLVLPVSLITYGLNNFLFLSAPELMSMRDSLTVSSIGTGSYTFIKWDGKTRKISVNTSKSVASKKQGYIKIDVALSANELDSRIVALDFNAFAITIDAEIY